MNQALRVAQLANFVTPTSGGLRVVVDELARSVLDGGGHRLRLVPGRAPDHGPAQPPHVAADGRDRTVAVAGFPLPGSRGRYHVLLHRGTVARALTAFGPDVIEVHDQTTLAWAGRWARRHAVPCLLVAHERLDHVAARTTHLSPAALERPARRWAARLSHDHDAVVCASDFAAEPFRAAGATNVHRIPFGVDLRTFAPRPRVDESPWRSGALRLVLIGRLSREKEPGTALDVLARLGAAGLRTHLVILGHGPLEPSLRARARAERLPVTFLGHVAERGRVAQLLAGADVALAPGPCETFGLGVLEALACGTPVVASDSGAAKELLAPGAGGTGRTADGLARAVRTVLARPDAGGRARAHAEQFSWERACAAFAELRAQLVRHPSTAPEPIRRAPAGAPGA